MRKPDWWLDFVQMGFMIEDHQCTSTQELFTNQSIHSFGNWFDPQLSEQHLQLNIHQAMDASVKPNGHETLENWFHAFWNEYHWFLWDQLKRRNYDVTQFSLCLSIQQQNEWIQKHRSFDHFEAYVLDAIVDGNDGMPNGPRIAWMNELGWMMQSLQKDVLAYHLLPNKTDGWLQCLYDLEYRIDQLSQVPLLNNSNWMELLAHESVYLHLEQLEQTWKVFSTQHLKSLLGKKYTPDFVMKHIMNPDHLFYRPHATQFKKQLKFIWEQNFFPFKLE